MRVFLNGVQWNSGAGKTKPMDIANFVVGRGVTGAYPWFGNLDELSIWNKELSLPAMQQMMYHQIDNTNPDYSHLLAYYKFDEDSGLTAYDSLPFTLRGDLMFVFALGCACMVVLLLLLYRTRLGLATRAVSQQPTAAELCGISITRVNVLTFVITGVVGGVAGAMTGAAIGMLSPLLSLPLTVKGLIVTVIGGLGSIPGAIIAGLVVGGLENFFQFARGVSERDLYIMLLLFAFLVFRPGGVFAMPAGRD
jgi:branched-subunit amino acid ABC-type transport system permease component